jgi:hypothetical protein
MKMPVEGSFIIVVVSSVFLLIGLGLLYMAIHNYLLYKKIKNTPTSKIRSIAIGLAEIFGKARCSEELYTPISKTKCAYYELDAEYYSSGKHSRWVSFYMASQGRLFFIEDETGKILVDSKGAGIQVQLDKTFPGDDPEVLRFIKSLPDNVKSKFDAHSRSEISLKEYYIAEDDLLYVLGSVESREGTTNTASYENLVMRKGRDNIMIICDGPEKGVLPGLFWTSIIFGIIGAFITIFVLTISVSLYIYSQLI